VDFSENFDIPVKYEPQSMHWYHESVTVHSGIMFVNGEKYYLPYLSDDKSHDQHFVDSVLDLMLEGKDLDMHTHIVIGSDNCSVQYKSALHFKYLQQLANKLGKSIIRIYGIASHGKGEVDHVGGLIKTCLRRSIGSGNFFHTSEEMVTYLQEKFQERNHPKYEIHEILVSELEKKRVLSRLEVANSVDGSSTFQIMLFSPNKETFKAAPRLCICNECRNEYGSCTLFKEYTPTVFNSNITVLLCLIKMS
jgi:hypothetical protein